LTSYDGPVYILTCLQLAVMPSLDTLDISHNKIRRFPAHPGRLVDLRVRCTSNRVGMG